MGYAGRPIHPTQLLVALLLTFVAAIGVLGGLIFHSFYIVIDVSALLFWLVVIFKRLEVTEEGIYIKTLPISIDFVYSFDNIEKIKFRGPLMQISKKKGGSSYWLMIAKKGFVEEMRRYAPQKLG